MPKKQTLEIQNFLEDLGEHLGLISRKEVQLDKENYYSPIYDVVWFLDLDKKFNLDILNKYVSNNKCIQDLKLLPIAVFEIEGAATSSKNQLGNLSNITFSDIFLKFIIVNNEAAIPEKDSYRRGLKIVRYFENNFGNENIIFLDWNHIKNTYKWLNIKEEDKEINSCINNDIIRDGFGGENKSIDIFNEILQDLIYTKLEIKQNYTPDKCKLKYYIEDYVGKLLDSSNNEVNFYLKKLGCKDPNTKEIYNLKSVNSRYYLPKLDVVLGFNLPTSILKWLKGLSNIIENDIINSSVIFYLKNKNIKKVFVPLISIEIETTTSKHLNGGIVNMWKNSYVGILVANKEALGHINFFKNYGCNNVFLYDYKNA